MHGVPYYNMIVTSLEGQLGLILCNEADENHPQIGNYVSHLAQLCAGIGFLHRVHPV
jgi:hypothetical protein